MSQPANVEIYLQKKLARICTRFGCEAEASLDNEECPAHHEDSKKRKRESAARKRAERRRRRKCIDCQARAKTLRCRPCERRNRPNSISVDKQSISVDKREQIWRVDPNTNWSRYRGKGRRGRLTREEQIDEDVRDAAFAIEELRKFVEKAAVLKRAEIMALPTIQRDAARREVGQHLGFSGRILDDLNERYG